VIEGGRDIIDVEYFLIPRFSTPSRPIRGLIFFAGSVVINGVLCVVLFMNYDVGGYVTQSKLQI